MPPADTLLNDTVTVSVITPCYNGARFIEATLRSALQQSMPPVEIIVIDDGSTDDSAAIAESVGTPVRVLRQPNGGESSARNRGIREAVGTHALFLDADDLLAPEAIERLAQAVRGRPRSVAVMGYLRFSESPSIPLSTTPSERTSFFPDIIETNFGPPMTWLAPLSLIRDIGGFAEDMRWSEDWEMLWRLGLHADGLVPVDYIGALYRIHPQSQFATNSMANRCRGHAAILTRMIPAMVKYPTLAATYGDRLFWGGWTALTRALEAGVPYHELEALTTVLRDLASRGPECVRQLRSARIMRVLGVRPALFVQRVLWSRG